jgi:CSLREA domain-containing protein
MKIFTHSLSTIFFCFVITPSVMATSLISDPPEPPCRSNIKVTKTKDTNDFACTSSDCSLREAISMIDTCNYSSNIVLEIYLPGGLFVLNKLITIRKTLRIIGAGVGSTMIDGNNAHRIFDITNGVSTLRGLNLQHGFDNTQNSGGGAVRVGVSSSLRLRDVVVVDNKVSGSNVCGGAIANSGNLIVEDNVYFAFNSAPEGQGGAICSLGYTSLYGATFNGNSAKSSGAIFGGAVGGVVINNSKFMYNTAIEQAGAISVLNYAIINNTSFTNNNANRAGALALRHNSVKESDLTLSDSTFANNHALTEGGGAAYLEGRSTINTTLFDSNTAITDGGALAILSNSPTIINDSTLRIGSAGAKGGAIFATGEVTINRSSLYKNSAPQGGAISSSYRTSLFNTTINGNSATENGAAVSVESGKFTSKNSTISANGAGTIESIWTSSLGATIMNHTIVETAQGVPTCKLNGEHYSFGHNLETAQGCLFDQPSDFSDAFPYLNPMSDLGGKKAGLFNEKVANLHQSPGIWIFLGARDAGAPVVNADDIPSELGCLKTDARGYTRFRGARCDIGAVEY